MMYYVFKGAVKSSSSSTDPSFNINNHVVDYILGIDINSAGILKHPDGTSETLPYKEITESPYSFYEGHYFAEIISGNLFQITAGLDKCCFIHYIEYLKPEFKPQSFTDAHICTLTFSSKLVDQWCVGDNFVFKEEGSGFEAQIDLQLINISDKQIITPPHIEKKFPIWKQILRFVFKFFNNDAQFFLSKKITGIQN